MSATVYLTRGRRRRRYVALVIGLSLAALTTWQAAEALLPAASPRSAGTGSGWASISWPVEGAAAAAVGDGRVHAHGSTRPQPIASLAKVMTAFVVLRSRPINPPDPGFTITVTSYDVGRKPPM